MSALFQNATTFNADIGAWDTSKVVNMEYMFSGATSFNQNITGWNLTSITIMKKMFEKAINFNHNVGNWDIGTYSETKVKEMLNAYDTFYISSTGTPTYNFFNQDSG